jgi:hypothetical protein
MRYYRTRKLATRAMYRGLHAANELGIGVAYAIQWQPMRGYYLVQWP